MYQMMRALFDRGPRAGRAVTAITVPNANYPFGGTPSTNLSTVPNAHRDGVLAGNS
jgi:hypothetical protein